MDLIKDNIYICNRKLYKVGALDVHTVGTAVGCMVQPNQPDLLDLDINRSHQIIETLQQNHQRCVQEPHWNYFLKLPICLQQWLFGNRINNRTNRREKMRIFFKEGAHLKKAGTDPGLGQLLSAHDDDTQ